MIGEARIIKHHLREVRDLCSYRIVGTSQALGTLSGLVVDPESWKVAGFLISRRSEPGDPHVIPVQSFRTIDDAQRTLEIGQPGEGLRSAQPGRPDTPASGQPVDTSAIIGRSIDGRDGPAGRIVDLLVNVNVWELRYLVIESESRRVLTDIEWCSSVNEGKKRPRVDLPAVAINTAPPYQALEELCSGYEEALYRHYTNRAYVAESDVA